jgi:hypothetical protein
VSDARLALYPFIVLSAAVAWLSAVILVILARQRPRIAFLVERAVGAVILAIATTSYAIIAHNTDHGFPWFDSDTARLAVRLLFIALGFIPLIWLALYWRRRS